MTAERKPLRAVTEPDAALPADVVAERALLGDLFHTPARIVEALEVVNGDSFASPGHGLLFDALVALFDDDQGYVDVHTVARHLEQLKLIDAVGGRTGLVEILGAGSGAWRRHARAVAAAAEARRWVYFAREVEHAARNGGNVEALLARAAEMQKPKGDRLLTTAELVALPPPEWIVDGVLPARSLVLLYGPSTAGKSFVAIDLAAHLAAGRPWHGHPVRTSRVLYVAAEGVAGVGRRVDAWCSRHGVEPGALAVDWIPHPVNLGDDQAAAELARHTEQLAAQVVVVDTLARCCVGVDENSGRDMGLVVANCERLQAAGASVLLVHHAGKDLLKGARGHSSLKAAIDAEFEVSVASKGLAGIKNTKQKDAPTAAPMALRITPHASSAVLEWEPIGPADDTSGQSFDEVADVVVEFLTEAGTQMSKNALGKAMRAAGHQLRSEDISRAADLAVDDGRLVCRLGPRNAKLLEVADAPREEQLGAV